ncbi:MAG TPA: nucleotide exchange factor GrpE [Mycoplasmatales bacterium]|nr:nucleotide exchange factor GrpE [Mycoplasmatales bacterium]
MKNEKTKKEELSNLEEIDGNVEEVKEVLENKIDEIDKEKFQNEFIESEYLNKIKIFEDEIRELNVEKDILKGSLEKLEREAKINAKEMSGLAKYSNQKIILKTIPLIDSLEEALKVFGSIDNTDVQKVLKGFSMMISNFKDNDLKNEGLSVYPIKLNEDMWDSSFSEVFSEIENEEFESGTIVKVIRNCYFLNDRMIRPALVVISKKSNVNHEEEKII